MAVLSQSYTCLVNLTRRELSSEHWVGTTVLPAELLPDRDAFERLWAMRPDEFPVIKMHGRDVKTPRWYRAYGHAYVFSGQVSEASLLPENLGPFLAWAQGTIDERLNGLLVNWYDGALKHYIGRHRDSRHGLQPDSPIVTVSLGASRVLRVRPWKGAGVHDFPVGDGSVIVLPYATNLAFTHEVLHTSAASGRRISLTFRAFTS